MSEPDLYSPIACELHDRLESAATLRQVVRIVVAEPGVAPREFDDRIVDVFTREGAEFIRTRGGEVIRLDRLDSVDGVPFRTPPPPAG